MMGCVCVCVCVCVSVCVSVCMSAILMCYSNNVLVQSVLHKVSLSLRGLSQLFHAFFATYHMLSLPHLRPTGPLSRQERGKYLLSLILLSRLVQRGLRTMQVEMILLRSSFHRLIMRCLLLAQVLQCYQDLMLMIQLALDCLDRSLLGT